MKPIQFIDLAAQQRKIQRNIEQRISNVLSHGKYIMGPEVYEFEQELMKFSNVKHAISCANGTDALLMILMALGIKKGDAVFTTPFSFIATSEVISILGATPVFVDVDSETHNLDPEQLEQAIKALKNNDSSIYPLPHTQSKTPLNPKVVIPVDLFGLASDYRRINEVAKKHDLFVLGDGAQSFGALYMGEHTCNFSEASTTSFFPAKPLGCYGDGGAVFTNDDFMAEKIKSIRIHGKGKNKYDNIQIGLNSRLDTIQAAILLEKIIIFPEEIKSKNRIASIYSDALKDKVHVPHVPKGQTSVWAQYSIKSSKRDKIVEQLNLHKIPTAIYYPQPLHFQNSFSSLLYKKGNFPISEKLSKTIFSVPMHPYLTEDQIEYIILHLLKIIN